MTMIFSCRELNLRYPFPSGGLIRWIGRGAFALAGWLERRAAIRALRERDDRELRDIGIVRSQIEAAVGGAFSPDTGRMW